MKEKKDKERESLLNDLLNVCGTVENQEELTPLRKQLLEITLRNGHKEFDKELDNLCQVQIELTKLKSELEDLKNQQQQAQILTPTSSTTNRLTLYI